MTSETISTKHCILRRYSDDDRNEFCRIFTDESVMQYMGDGPCESEEKASLLFDRIMEIYQKTDKHFEIWAITIENRLAGHFELKQTVNTSQEELEIIYLLDKPYWGKQLMPEVVKEIKNYAAGYSKQLIATVNPENWNSIKVLERSGNVRCEWVEIGGEKVFKIWLL